MTEVTYNARELGFDRAWISDAALQVAAGLQAAGYDGYLVGGCVRDLLLHRRPKDFDITTDASPEQVKAVFRRARIIGRRFKLVHVRHGREIIEVATYRAKPDGAAARKFKAEREAEIAAEKEAQRGHRGRPARPRRAISERGRVMDDNIFGTIEQDARRRDFTINALYYDPSREVVVDYQGGVKDARRQTLRIIGDARQRFTEDPVRMLRALRFRAKLGLRLQDGLDECIAECAGLIVDVPAARLFDEALKLFHYGHAARSWRELQTHDLAEKLFPLTAASLASARMSAAEMAAAKSARALIDAALQNTDQRVGEGKPVIPAFLFAVLLWKPYCDALAMQPSNKPREEAVWSASSSVFAKQRRRVSVPRKVSDAVAEIWAMQDALQKPEMETARRLLPGRRFRAGYDFLLMRARAGEVDAAIGEWWTKAQEGVEKEDWFEGAAQADADARAARIRRAKKTGRPRRRGRKASRYGKG